MHDHFQESNKQDQVMHTDELSEMRHSDTSFMTV